MYAPLDNIYAVGEGTEREYYTESYMTHNGYISGYNWVHHGRTSKIIECKYSELPADAHIICNYDQLFWQNSCLILCNEIVEYGNGPLDLSLDSGDDEDGEKDIFQYYLIDEETADSLKRHTQQIVYYHEGLCVYILGVTHCGTSWDYISAEFIK